MYDLAFINHSLSANDNRLVVGYDNTHGHHIRHSAGQKRSFPLCYEKLLERFLKEVREVREKKEPM
jgi:hypothetical protein